jgi:hypothetical protein
MDVVFSIVSFVDCLLNEPLDVYSLLVTKASQRNKRKPEKAN